MNIKVVANSAGIFAKVILALQTVKHHCVTKGVSISDIESIYFESKPNIENNLFDFALEQNELPKYDITLQSRKFKSYNKMFSDSDLPFFKVVFDKLVIKDSVLNRVDENISEDTLGIHIRLTDMNTLHGGNYGIRDYNSYLKVINSVIKGNRDIKNIFVSSDNIESIDKLSKEFDIITNSDISNRNATEVDGTLYNKTLKENHLEEKFWVDSFLDMISLAKCGRLVKGVSSLSNTSIIVSNTLKDVYYV